MGGSGKGIDRVLQTQPHPRPPRRKVRRVWFSGRDDDGRLGVLLLTEERRCGGVLARVGGLARETPRAALGDAFHHNRH